MYNIGLKFLFALLFITVLFQTAQVQAENADELSYYETTNREIEVIVMYKNEEGKEAILQNSSQIIYEFETISALTVLIQDSMIKSLEEDPNIICIEENNEIEILIMELEILGNIDEISQRYSEELQWGFHSMGIRQAWNEGYNGDGIKIGIIDSGIALHPEFTIAGGVSTFEYTDSWQDDHGHGTLVAGIVAAQQNGFGMTGIAPNVELYAIKSLNKEGTGKMQNLYEGIEWAIQNDMDIINLSIGVKKGTVIFEELLNEAYDKGIVIIAAAGNDGLDNGSGNTVVYPAKYENSIAVSAIDPSLNRAEFSATGEEVEFSAPGKFIVTTYLDNQYALASGTSLAAPHITGFLAILKQMYPTMSNEEIRKEMIKYSLDLGDKGKDNWYGYGFVTYSFDNHPEIPNPDEENGDSQEISEETKKMLEDASQQVQQAERKRKLKFINAAEDILEQLPEIKGKQELMKRLNIVIDIMMDYANFQVRVAESNQTLFFIDTAERAVEELKEGIEKSALQDRINVIKNNMGLVDFDTKEGINPFYNWTITFNTVVDSSTITNKSIYVKHESKLVEGTEVFLNDDGESATLKAPQNAGYNKGGFYYIYIEKDVKSKGIKELKNPVVMKFIVAEE